MKIKEMKKKIKEFSSDFINYVTTKLLNTFSPLSNFQNANIGRA